MATVYNEKEKIWSGPEKQVVFEHTNIAVSCLKSLMEDPEQIAQIFHPSGREYTNREIIQMSVHVAQHFRDHLKMAQGSIVGVCAANSDYVVPLFFGSLLAGLVFSATDPQLDKVAIKHMYSIVQPSIMLCDGDVYSKVSEAMDEIELKIPIYTMRRHIAGVPEITEFLQSTAAATFSPHDWHLDSKQTALISCSSGTTGLGLPKAICISHNDLSYIAAVVTPFKRKLCFSNLHWVSGYLHVIGCAVVNATNITSEIKSTKDFFDIVEKYRIDCCLTYPPYLNAIAADPQLPYRDLSSLKVIRCGGGTLLPTHFENVRPYLPNANILNVYGLSEILGACAVGWATANHCAVQLQANFAVKIIDDMGNRLGPNEKGEICIKTPYTGMQYYKNPEANASTFIDGWVHSGDIGYFDEDNNLFAVDRKKEMFRTSAIFHIAPSELEAIIYELNGIAEVCVFGIPQATKFNFPAAAVFLTPGSELTEKDIVDYVAANTVEYKHLEGGVFILPDPLPKTSTDKIIRKAVFNICEQLWKKQTK